MHINDTHHSQAIALLHEVCEALGIEQEKRTREELRRVLKSDKHPMQPIDTMCSKIEDAIWSMSKDCNDSTEWWSFDHPYAIRTGETFASRLMVKIKGIIDVRGDENDE